MNGIRFRVHQIKMKLLVFALVLSLALSVKVEQGYRRAITKHIDELKTTEWGTTILELVSLHSMSQGPVSELITAISDLIDDLSGEVEELEEEFRVRTQDHNSQVTSLTLDIQDAFVDVQRTADTLDNLLKPRRAQLTDRIENLKEQQEYNKKTVAEITLVREQDHEEYEKQVTEFNEATSAVDDALGLLANLQNPSLAQMKNHVEMFKKSLRHIETKLNPKSEHSALIKALIMLASEENFSDQGSLRQIVDKLNEFRNSVVDALNDLTLSESQHQEEFEERLAQLASEYAEHQRGINANLIDLDATETIDKIEELARFQAQREADQITFQESLDLENSQYGEETEIFTDLRNNYLRELGITEEALKLVESADLKSINF